MYKLCGTKLIQSDYGWYIYNANGDVVALADGNGVVTRNYEYDPYGVELGENNSHDVNPYRYSGQYKDLETGYVYLRARYYDASTGRFINQDPAMDGHNWYIYCNGNPLLYVDPTGMWPQWLKDAGNWVGDKISYTGNRIGEAATDFGTGFADGASDFFVSQYEYVKQSVNDPVGYLKDYYSIERLLDPFGTRQTGEYLVDANIRFYSGLYEGDYYKVGHVSGEMTAAAAEAAALSLNPFWLIQGKFISLTQTVKRDILTKRN